MGFANVRRENLHTDVGYCCIIATTRKWGHVSLFVESKYNVLIRLHSSTFVYTRLHSFSDSFVFLE